jgi:hypothetical protein
MSAYYSIQKILALEIYKNMLYYFKTPRSENIILRSNLNGLSILAFTFVFFLASCSQKGARYEYVLAKGCKLGEKIKIDGLVEQIGLDKWRVSDISAIEKYNLSDPSIFEIDRIATIKLQKICENAPVERIRDFGSFSKCKKRLRISAMKIRRSNNNSCSLESRLAVFDLEETN